MYGLTIRARSARDKRFRYESACARSDLTTNTKRKWTVQVCKCFICSKRRYILKWLRNHHLPNTFKSVIIVKKILRIFCVRLALAIFARTVELSIGRKK
uniref:Uncharacterized protein n=1 Tax=Magallana gigas TaxID=29159 RepID=A0A8W8MHW5_MAGGI